MIVGLSEGLEVSLDGLLFGEALGVPRQRLGALAERVAHVHARTQRFGHWVRHEHEPSATQLTSVMAGANVSVDWLFRGERWEDTLTELRERPAERARKMAHRAILRVAQAEGPELQLHLTRLAESLDGSKAL